MNSVGQSPGAGHWPTALLGTNGKFRKRYVTWSSFHKCSPRARELLQPQPPATPTATKSRPLIQAIVVLRVICRITLSCRNTMRGRNNSANALRSRSHRIPRSGSGCKAPCRRNATACRPSRSRSP